jgi:hypothetical protein
MALTFNDIEYYFEAYMPFLIAAPEDRVSALFAEEGTFQRKAERFQRVLNAIAKERLTLAPKIREIHNLIEQAKGLADKRNQYVHGLVISDIGATGLHLRTRGKEVQVNVSEVNFLTGSVEILCKEIGDQCAELSLGLADIRNEKK